MLRIAYGAVEREIIMKLTKREARILNDVLVDGMPAEQDKRDFLADISNRLEDFINE